MPQIRPITDLRNTTEISDICHAKREPIFITKNGYGDHLSSLKTVPKRIVPAAQLSVCRNADLHLLNILETRGAIWKSAPKLITNRG